MPDRVREDPTWLVGEHLHRSLFAEDTELAPFAGVADRLAEHESGRLYSPQRLARADVPVAAAVDHADAFVPREFSTYSGLSPPHPRQHSSEARRIT